MDRITDTNQPEVSRKPKITWGLQLMLWIIGIFQKPLKKDKVNRFKKQSNSKSTAYFFDLVRSPVGKVSDCTFPSDGHQIPLRIYHPNPTELRPGILFFHGGGFVVGGIKSYDHYCRKLCRKIGYVVVSVDYRLAPEHKFPAAHNDALSAYRWIKEEGKQFGVDTDNLFLMGDSAGGNLAISTVLESNDKVAIKGQVLVYPPVDFLLKPRIYFDQYLLGEKLSKWFAKQYLNTFDDAADQRLSVLNRVDLNDLPPTLLIKAEYDHLNDGIVALESKLQELNVETTSIKYENTFHGFVTMMNWSRQARHSLNDIRDFLRSDSLDY